VLPGAAGVWWFGSCFGWDAFPFFSLLSPPPPLLCLLGIGFITSQRELLNAIAPRIGAGSKSCLDLGVLATAATGEGQTLGRPRPRTPRHRAQGGRAMAEGSTAQQAGRSRTHAWLLLSSGGRRPRA
jgi:hypothetical protein